MAPQRAKGPWVFGVFVDQLKRLADVPICNCTKPPTFEGTKRFNPTAQHLDKEHLGHPREHSELAAALATIRCRIVSDHGAEGSSHSLQRPKSGPDQDAAGGKTATGALRGSWPRYQWDVWESRTKSPRLSLRRFKFCHGHRTVRRWWAR
jgi:hypothetical protein